MLITVAEVAAVTVALHADVSVALHGDCCCFHRCGCSCICSCHLGTESMVSRPNSRKLGAGDPGQTEFVFRTDVACPSCCSPCHHVLWPSSLHVASGATSLPLGQYHLGSAQECSCGFDRLHGCNNTSINIKKWQKQMRMLANVKPLRT